MRELNHRHNLATQPQKPFKALIDLIWRMIGHIVIDKNKDEKWHTVQGFTTIKELTLLASLLLFFS